MGAEELEPAPSTHRHPVADVRHPIVHGCITRDTPDLMADVTIRELRNHGGEVVDRAKRGERLTITRAGQPVAQIVARGTPSAMGAATRR
jgi:prevent-host-death family protein